MHTLRAVCGNQQCELGEQCTTPQCTGGGQCAADCPLQSLECGDGCGHTGRCLPSTGTCECFTGYVGSNCSSCDRGYVLIGSTCVFLPGALVSCSDGVRYGVANASKEPPCVHLCAVCASVYYYPVPLSSFPSSAR